MLFSHKFQATILYNTQLTVHQNLANKGIFHILLYNGYPSGAKDCCSLL